VLKFNNGGKASVRALRPPFVFMSQNPRQITRGDYLAPAKSCVAVQPAAERFHRPRRPLSQVIDSGAMSMRQNDRGTNHRRMRNNDSALIPGLFGGEPFSHPP
jgi:hypothetical protein